MNYADYAAIGERIRKRRISLKLTQSDLSERAGISVSFLGHIERGTRKMSLETLMRLSDALNCSADSILGTSCTDQDTLILTLERICDFLSTEFPKHMHRSETNG